MNTNNLKRFAREARIKLVDQVGRKLEFVLSNADPVFQDTNASQIQSLKNKIQAQGKEQVIDTVAYTWFNRLMALRFMDANGYTSPKVVTPVVGKSPEILQNALSGQIDENLKINRQRLNDLLDGKLVIADAQTEAYKMLLIASCNQWHTAMPFMFERISDYTELLLPDDLLSENSIITDIRNGMSDEDCGQEELIGWLYQFYIADKKDDVFEGLKKNIKITAANIPAATQLFTPRWIVRYMVENTLGKLWLTLKPNSKLRQFMPYYIEAPEGNAPAPLPEGIKGVIDITFLDPCQGSGHVLVYAFDLFTKIYEEEGYNTNEIPALILEHNLFGIDIDERAAQLAAFALTMKARSYFSRFLRKPVQPNVIALENVSEEVINQAIQLPITIGEKNITDYKDLTLYNLTQADNFGSLIQINPEELKAIQVYEGSVWQEQEQKLKEQGEYLSKQYHCVVTNPPYMGGKGMNDSLKEFVEINYKSSKADLMTCFMQRCISLIYENCSYGMINLPSWLFLSSFEELRKEIIGNFQIDTLLHMGRGVFGIDFGSTAFVISKKKSNQNGIYFRLHKRNFQHIYFQHIEQLFLRANLNREFQYDFNEYRDDEGVSEIPDKSNIKGQRIYYSTNQLNFKKIPGSPIGYWLGDNFISIFEKSQNIESLFEVGSGLSTSDNSRFLRYHWEVGRDTICLEKPTEFSKKWYLFQKGGDFRKWYGNLLHVVNWKNDGEEIKYWVTHNPKDPKTNHWSRRIFNTQLYFRKGITWSVISAGNISFRYTQSEAMISNAAGGIFGFEDDNELYMLLCSLNSKLSRIIFSFLNPTINYSAGVIQKSPLIIPKHFEFSFKQFIEFSKNDWDAHEYSLDFKANELISTNLKNLNASLNSYSDKWLDIFNRLKQGEEELNLNFFKIFGLQEEFSEKLTFEDITILQEETKIINGEIFIDPVPVLLQLVSYSIGCLFGRYSLDKPALILANQGETLQDFLKQVSNPSFMPDEDNIIPVLEGEWFNDDIVGRFKVFLKAAFGEEHFEENLKYIEDTIGKDIRKYFVKDFYNDHIKRYKKRPIYWMFSSPKGHFKALIYMHRYTPDLCSKMLTDYLQSYTHKLEAAQQNKIAESLREDLPAREKAAATKEADRYSVMIKDCKEYAQTLYAVATKKITIDLDDGVKVNYQKFKEVVVPIKGLEKDEE
jgi:hypothetical protein